MRAYLIGAPLFDEGSEGLLNDCEKSNRELLSALRRDDNEEALHKIAVDDWQKGRMTRPMKAKDVDLSQAGAATHAVTMRSMCTKQSHMESAVKHLHLKCTPGPPKRAT